MSITLLTTFTQITCCHEGCGITFAVPAHWEAKRREDHATWYCPNGHSQGFYGKSEAERLRDELTRKQATMDQLAESRRVAWQRFEEERRRTSAVRGQVTKLKRRAAAGVCPCCNRTVKQLAAHMAEKHPAFVKEHGVRGKAAPKGG